MVPVDNAVGVRWKYISLLHDEFIYGGFLTSLGSPIMIVCAAMMLNAPVSVPLLAISYMVPLIVYCLNYYEELENDRTTNPERYALASRKASRYPQLIVLYVAFLVILIVLFSGPALAVFAMALLLGGVFYTLFFKGVTKKVPGFKNLYTSFIWACDGAFFLAAYDPGYMSIACFFVFLFMLVKSLVNTIFFDIKDVEADKKEGLRTIPAVLGKDKALSFLQALNLAAYVPLLAGTLIVALPAFTLSLTALFFYTHAYLRRAERPSGTEIRHMSYTLAEAEIILWPILLAAGRALA
jgi:4-hydroxybenzoate polyprenyltransferase